MAIYKLKNEIPYAQIPNSTAQDNRLSFEARGVLVMLLSMPDDWEVNKKWVENQTSAGRDKINRIFNELIELGYIRKSNTRTSKGKFSSNDMFVYSSPPVDGLAVDGLAVDGKTVVTKETVIQNKQDTNNDCFSDEKAIDHELIEKAFIFIWKSWKDAKKQMGKIDTSSKSVSFDKHFKLIFNRAYFKKHSIEDFRSEINQISKFIKAAHEIEGFNKFENMQLPKFLSQKQWRD